jgi:hypothetical protein
MAICLVPSSAHSQSVYLALISVCLDKNRVENRKESDFWKKTT